MPDKEDRGTTDDPAWGEGDLTGGNDSGTAVNDADKGEEPTGPDRTARVAQADNVSVAGTRSPDPIRTSICATRSSASLWNGPAMGGGGSQKSCVAGAGQ